MANTTPFNWLNSTKPQRRKLYEAYRSVFKDARSMRDAVESALQKKTVGDRYIENFARAISAIVDTPALFNYLHTYHRTAADDLMRTLEPSLLSPWEAYYRKHRVDNRLAVALWIDHASPLFRAPPGIKQLFRDDLFYLQLDSDIEGHAVGFWKTRHHWYRLFGRPTRVTVGRQWVTRDDVSDDALTVAIFGSPVGTGEIRPISYRGKDRYPEFVVVVADLPTVNQFADRVGTYEVSFKERALDMFPSILETSKSPWSISWVSPSFVPQDAFYDRSE